MNDGSKISDIVSMNRMYFPESQKKEDILNILIDGLQDQPGLESRDVLSEAIYKREELMSTGIGIGLAIPHCRLDGIKKIRAAVALCPQGVDDYVSLDNKKVQIIIMILAGRHQQTEYIQVLSLLSSKLKDESFRSRLLAVKTPQDAISIITEGK